MPRPSKYLPELRERAVRMVFDREHQQPTRKRMIDKVRVFFGPDRHP